MCSELRKNKLTSGFSLSVSDDIKGDAKNVSIENFSLSAYSKMLFENSSLVLSYGKKYGVVGVNGVGKSTLLKHLAARSLPIDERMDLLYVEQEIEGTTKTAIQTVLEGNPDRMELLSRLEASKSKMDDWSDDDLEQYNAMEQEWRDNKYDRDESRARGILHGLGFKQEEQDQHTELFSGGWRMRISLAKALYRNPTLLMLDEPTNHLDLNAVIWLTDYLTRYEHSVVVISHNKNFLNEVCTDTIHIDKLKCNQYSGNYDQYLRTSLAKERELEKKWDALQKKIKSMKKKSVPKKEVQAFIKKSGVERPPKSRDIKIRFAEPGYINGVVCEMQDVTFGYGENVLLENTDFSITMESRIAIVGPNGVGKSTLIKLLIGDIDPMSGTVSRNRQCRIGYYSQHLASSLPLDQNPIAYLSGLFEREDMECDPRGKIKSEYIRGLLGKIGLEGSHHTKLIGELSGGQKARVAFVKLLVSRPNVLILDEPSNHLDIETISAFVEAINEYEGGVVIISHDVDLITQTDCMLYNMEEGSKTINRYNGTYDDYREEILDEINSYMYE